MGQNEVINPHALYAEEGIEQEPPVLSEDHKRQLAESGNPFTVVKVVDDLAGDFGRFLQLTAVAEGYTFRFNMSDPTDRAEMTPGQERAAAEYAAIKRATDEGAEVGPYRLDYIPWKGGNPFYKLEPAVAPIQLTEAPHNQLEF